MEYRGSLVFQKIWVGAADIYIYGRVDIGLVHYGNENYCQIYLTIGSIMVE